MHRAYPLLCIAACLCAPGGLASTALGQSGPALVAATPLVQREIHRGETFIGTIKPLRKSTVGSAVDGRVLEFPINEGDFIGATKPLAQLKTETLKIEISAAMAELKLRQIERDEMIKLRDEEIDEAKARMDGAMALRDFTKGQLNRTKTLYENGTITIEQLQEVASVADRAVQSYLEAKAAHALVAGSQKIPKSKARVKAQEEAVRRLEDMLAKHTIVAPFSGYIVAEHVEVGQWVSPGDPIAEIVDLSTVEVEAAVPQEFFPMVRRESGATMFVEGLTGQVFTGTVKRLVPQADERARTFPVKIHVDNAEHALKSGMLASVLLPVGDPVNAVLVPKDALVLGGPQVVIYVLDAQTAKAQRGKVRRVPVRLGVAFDQLIQVVTSDSLKAGAMVVVEGNERLADAAEVKIAKIVPAEAYAPKDPAKAPKDK